MIHIQVNNEEFKAMYLEKLEQRMKEIEGEVFFMSSKDLCRFVGMSWTTVSSKLLSDPDFPCLRNGNRWVFPKEEVTKYLRKYYEAVRSDTGDIQTYKRKGG